MPSMTDGARASQPPRWSPLSIRRIWLGMDRDVAALAWASSPAGAVLLHVAFLVALVASRQVSTAAVILISLTLASCTLWPARRLALIALSGLTYILLRPFRYSEQREFVDRMREAAPELAELPHLVVQAPLVVAFLATAGLALTLHRRMRATLFGRRPLLCQFAALGLLLMLGLQLEAGSIAHSVLWTLVAIFSGAFFFLAYAFADQRGKDDTPVLWRLGFMRPFWGGPSIPFKGLAYLKTFEARTPEALAATQLRALKLIVWALVLLGLNALLAGLFYDFANWPTLNEALSLTATDDPLGALAGWGVVFKNFVVNILTVGAFWHALVAMIRMAGFAIPRNMARPLTARSIAEFWNRYLFYFKEVLVDFFFYPAFARWFKKQPRLRIACATFCAAFIGNVLFTLVTQAHIVAELGPLAFLERFESYIFYAFVLGVALIISQLRKHKPRPEDGVLRYSILPRIGVIGFFAIMLVFADETGHLGLTERFDFLLSLVGA
jgi:hypothetical protein